jgi:hypothetical protein
MFDNRFKLIKELSGNDICISCLMEADISLPVVQKAKASWANVKQGLSNPHPNVRESAKKFKDFAGKNADLFTLEQGNPKMEKEGEAVPEFMSIGVSLSPHKSAETGLNFCPCATEDCKSVCLTDTGRGSFDPAVNEARKKRSQFLVQHPEHFSTLLDHGIGLAKQRAAKQGKKLAVRLNVFSDIHWEDYAPHLFEKHKDVQFYDYTKIGKRTQKQLPSNYHLTFSSTGVKGKDNNWEQAKGHLDKGGVVAMVFQSRPGKGKKEPEKLPSFVHDKKTGKKYRVIDGDIHDHRHLDHVYNSAAPGEGLIAGLHLKSPISGGFEKQVAKANDFAVAFDDDVVEINGDEEKEKMNENNNMKRKFSKKLLESFHNNFLFERDLGTPYDPNADDDNDGIPNRDDPDDDGDGLKDYEDPNHPDYIPPDGGGGGGGGGGYPEPDPSMWPDNWWLNKTFLQWLQDNFPEWYSKNQDLIRDRQNVTDPDGDGIHNDDDLDDDGDGTPDSSDTDHPDYHGGGGGGGRGGVPTSGKYRLPGTTPLDGWRDPTTGHYYSGWYGGHSPEHPRWRPPEPPPGGGGGQGGGGFGSGGGGGR